MRRRPWRFTGTWIGRNTAGWRCWIPESRTGGFRIQEGSLAEELVTDVPYVKDCIAFLLGRVRKCQTVEELRGSGTGVTPDCLCYRGFRLWHMNPEDYTRRAYIGEVSLRGRIRRLEETLEGLAEQEAETQERLGSVCAAVFHGNAVLCVCRLHGLAGRHAPDQRKRKGTAGAGKAAGAAAHL